MAKSLAMLSALEDGEAPRAGDESTVESITPSNLTSPLFVISPVLTSIATSPEVKTNGTLKPGDKSTGNDYTKED